MLVSEKTVSYLQDVENAREIMLKRGEQFLKRLMETRPKIVKLAAPFLTDGSVSVRFWDTSLIVVHRGCALVKVSANNCSEEKS